MGKYSIYRQGKMWIVMMGIETMGIFESHAEAVEWCKEN